MEELKDASMHHTALKLVSQIEKSKEYENIFKAVQKLVCNTNVDKFDLRTTLEDAVKSAGLDTEIRNIVYQLVRTSMKIDEKQLPALQQNAPDPLNFLRRAGMQWDRRVRKSLNAMCNELQIPLQGVPRAASEREELFSKWEELSNYTIGMDLSTYRPVYAPKDLLEVLAFLKGPTKNVESHEFVDIPKWEFSHIALPTKNSFELWSLFGEITRNDIYNGSTDIITQCQRVIGSKHAPLCQQMLKKGLTPPPYRGALWSYVLGCEKAQSQGIEYWHKLKNLVLETEHIVDKLIFKDVQMTASNDDQYFVFEDVLYQIMLCFSRDVEVAEMIRQDSPLVKTNKTYEGPPSGVVPFHGICMFAAPFCYLYDTPVELYYAFRAFYIRYCHRLTTINTNPQGIVSICLLFEKLLQTHEPELWSHLRELQIQPIRIVFKWLMRGFSGHLPPEQLLILWDLILGFDSLEILAFFAIIILSFRRESLMQVTSLDAIEAILSDLTSIKVLPLLQLALSQVKNETYN